MKKEIKLKQGLWELGVSPDIGGNITYLQYNGENVLNPFVSEKQYQNNPFVVGSPLLFPANRTYRGRFTFMGEEYTLPINEPKNNCNLHGSVYLQPFEVIKKSENKLTLAFENIKKVYPFKFRIEVCYELSDKGLTSSYKIKNTDDKSMPYTFALHTSFVEPEIFSVPVSLCQEKDAHQIPTGKYIPLNEQEKLYISGSKSKDTEISGYYLSCGNIAIIGDYTYTVSNNFDHWVLYNGMGKAKYICIEPQCGAVNGLALGGHKVLKSSEETDFWTKIELKF